MRRLLAVQGTASGVGKSLIAAGLLRYFARKGLRVAPFKAVNMSLHSGVTPLGEEMARSQILGAQAAGIPPDSRMNPILLKPEGGSVQVVLRGKVSGRFPSFSPFPREVFWRAIVESLESLLAEYNFVIVEGMGSPAEINLRERDLANMSLARSFGIPVLLVGDIERGGVFAALYGTWALCGEDRKLIRGFVINKLWGDSEVLRPGIRELEELTGVPVLGVLPHFPWSLDDEDSALFTFRPRVLSSCALRVGVLRLPHASNLTDFRPLELEDDVDISFVSLKGRFDDFDLLILPGTKSTLADLAAAWEVSLGERLKAFVAKGGVVLGVCGGFQMLGEVLQDPHGVEGGGEMQGLGLLPAVTVFAREKRLSLASGYAPLFGERVEGYEIHHGRSFKTAPCEAFFVLDGGEPEGMVRDGCIFGTYLHGLFDEGRFRRAFLNYVRALRGLPPYAQESLSWREFVDRELDRLAGFLSCHLNMPLLERILALSE
ncbi:MAG: cobyric acid synthase [Candidatus Caldatribacterium sp.]|nr:cobyric acid synthase [Candidatus Caldatribacterium sp.]